MPPKAVRYTSVMDAVDAAARRVAKLQQFDPVALDEGVWDEDVPLTVADMVAHPDSIGLEDKLIEEIDRKTAARRVSAALRKACLDDVDRAIIKRRLDQEPLTSIAEAVGLEEHRVAARLKAIQRRVERELAR